MALKLAAALTACLATACNRRRAKGQGIKAQFSAASLALKVSLKGGPQHCRVVLLLWGMRCPLVRLVWGACWCGLHSVPAGAVGLRGPAAERWAVQAAEAQTPLLPHAPPQVYKKQQEIAKLDALEQQARAVAVAQRQQHEQQQQQQAEQQAEQQGQEQQGREQQEAAAGEGQQPRAQEGAAPPAPVTEQDAASAALAAAAVAAEKARLEEQSLPLMLGALEGGEVGTASVQLGGLLRPVGRAGRMGRCLCLAATAAAAHPLFPVDHYLINSPNCFPLDTTRRGDVGGQPHRH